MKKMWEWAEAFCRSAGMKEAYFGDFKRRLSESPELLEEFQYYYENHDFLCRKKINGYTIIDLMIWRLDRFKSELDRDHAGRRNPDRMVLEAFDTMLRMEKEPETYLAHLLGDTGTDYFGKY